MNITVEYGTHKMIITLHDVKRQLAFANHVPITQVKEAIVNELLPDLSDVMLKIAEHRVSC